MGLFDLFSKKNKNENSKNTANQKQQESVNSQAPKSELYLALSKYNEYVVRYLGMQQQGNYAPISAYEKSNGEIIGFLYVVGDDDSYSLSADEVIERMENSFEQKMADNDIKSFVILYHSQFANDGNHSLANNDDELKAITISYHFKHGEKGKIGLPYRFEDDSITYQGITDFNQEENNTLFATQLEPGKEYFQDREEITAPHIENEIGLTIKRSNNSDLSNTWCGIFGFENYRNQKGGQVLREHFALSMMSESSQVKNNVAIKQLDYDSVILKGILMNETPSSIIPVVKTDYVIDIVNKQITEWENVHNLHAIISGGGRDTFGLDYLATDYAENRDRYHSQKAHQMNISGIAFVLDVSKPQDPNDEMKYSEDFTAYMPSQDLLRFACFDFIGELEDFKETTLLEDSSLKGYLMKVRLITNADFKDFFTIDMFVTPENMRFKELTVGMKLTGMVQLQGQIAE
ncbi:hypothetical protein [Fluviicola taffensis]|uniref:Uncharacterized protein n=1 Tax=Fluviicola taffensis (strain DSM 16823 / NCIMB 13979 / RW262) TaxID=755732 RepID=F2IF16_FLUTR|nr:hypothetical protein [Fluviicola taffensis]AEA42481.1 hypothetical protein Fluta_0476 [Fluviicola taffensis DSM 16823]